LLGSQGLEPMKLSQSFVTMKSHWGSRCAWPTKRRGLAAEIRNHPMQ
jgi:hypothetical protein